MVSRVRGRDKDRVVPGGPGVGTRVADALAISRPARGGPDDAGRRARPDLTGLRVPVVDDNKDAADTTAELIALAGADGTVAYSGPDGPTAALTRRPE